MDSVVAAQGELLRELSGVACELHIDSDQRQLAVQGLELLERTAEGVDAETSAAARAEALACELVTADARLAQAPGPTCVITVVRR